MIQHVVHTGIDFSGLQNQIAQGKWVKNNFTICFVGFQPLNLGETTLKSVQHFQYPLYTMRICDPCQD